MANESNRFKNRESSNSNRRKLIIESQNENEIIAHIYRADTDVIEEGTKIDADVLNEWDGKVERIFALTRTPDATEANVVGTPRVEITGDGRLKFIALKGATGAAGPTGIQGLQGRIGPQGLKGDTGNPAGFGSITANTVPLEVGSDPQANVVASGDNASKNLAFEFRLPKGIKGDIGPQGEKGDTGNPAGFGNITASAVALELGSAPQVSVVANGDNEAKNLTFEFGLPKGVKGDVGDSIFVRYSFDKISLTEQPTENTRYIGFYTGSTVSDNPSDYKWTHLWGAKSISMQDYSSLLVENRIDAERIYFVEGAREDGVNLTIDKIAIATVLGLSTAQLDQLVELAKITTVSGSENKEISFSASSLNIQ